MLSRQQLIKATATAATATATASPNGDQLYKFLRQMSGPTRSVTSLSEVIITTTETTAIPKQYDQQEPSVSSQATATAATSTATSTASSINNFNGNLSHISPFCGSGCGHGESKSKSKLKQHEKRETFTLRFLSSNILQQHFVGLGNNIQRNFHTQKEQQQQRNAKSSNQPATTTKFAMSSLAAEPLQAHKQADEMAGGSNNASNANSNNNGLGTSCQEAGTTTTTGKQPCFSTGLAEILQFMELIGNLKHTKRTGWVLRDVNDCESISGHMYRMSMLTFLLDGSEGLNQIRCMELALVHDLAESLVGDITPFCGVSKEEKRAMEFKAMEDICKLIEPRGKRIMELFEEYEHAESAESKFVKDLDRLDMVMQAFEYEKRDNCLLKHQEFFDSTEGKFNHPFVKKLVNEIYEQRQVLAKAKGATPPPAIEVPNMEAPAAAPKSPTKLVNGHGGVSS